MLKTLMVRALSYVLAGVFFISCVNAFAQISSQKMPYDFMDGNAPLTASELKAAFKGRTHEGFYRFDREKIPTSRFAETTASDGKVRHVQGDETLEGTWEIKGDRICFQYDDVWPNVYCFDIYRVGTCYYHYIRTRNDLSVNRWTARSTPKGEVPNCDIAMS